ncbi:MULTISPECIES: hypothetical protein [Neisseria]
MNKAFHQPKPHSDGIKTMNTIELFIITNAAFALAAFLLTLTE